MTLKTRTKSIIAAVLVLFALLLPALATPAQAVVDNGTGTFWLFNGTNGAGAWRDFNIGPDQTISISALKYVGGCTGGTCGDDYMNNTVSSVRFSCGGAGSPVDNNDWIKFYAADFPSGTAYLYDPVYPGGCTNGFINMNLASNINNLASSAVTNE